MESSETKAGFVTAELTCSKNTGSDSGSSETDDIETETDDGSTESGDSVYAPDGGWGWMVTLASFMVAFIVDGIVSSFGLLLPDLMAAYGSSVSMTSLPLALIVGMFLLSGPVTAYLVQRWGCRLVGFCGGLVAALGIAGSAYAPSIELFILSFGVLAGAGIGLIYLPSITMVNIYFNKKRGIVAGIITSGSGFGLLAMAPLTEMLMEEFGWRGCYLITSGIALNFCVCASLMRPLKPPAHRGRTGGAEPDIRQSNDVIHDEGVEYAVCDEKRHDKLYSFLSHEFHQKDHSRKDNPYLSLVGLEEVEGGNARTDLRTNSQHGSIWNSMKNLFLSNHGLSGSHMHLSNRDGTQRARTRLTRTRSHSHIQAGTQRSHCNDHINILSTWLACQVPPTLSYHSLHSHQPSDKMANSLHSHQASDKTTVLGSTHDHEKKIEIPWSRLTNSSRKHYHSDSRVVCDRLSSTVEDSDIARRLLRNQHHTHKTSILAVKVSEEKSSENNAAPSTTTEDLSSTDSARSSSVVEWVQEYRVFILFLVGAFLIQLVGNIAALLTPSYAYLFGVSKDQVATILSVYGLLNTLGRLMAGLLVYWGWSTLHVYNVGTLLAGLVCFAFPFCEDFPTIAVCLGLYGLFLGAFPPLQSVLLVEYLGIERLASTFGIMCLVKAFASSAGAPLAGLLYAVTGTYTVPVAACGGVLVLAAIFHQMMACCSAPRS